MLILRNNEKRKNWLFNFELHWAKTISIVWHERYWLNVLPELPHSPDSSFLILFCLRAAGVTNSDHELNWWVNGIIFIKTSWRNNLNEPIINVLERRKGQNIGRVEWKTVCINFWTFKLDRDRLTLQRKQSKLKYFLMNDGLIVCENVCHVVDLQDTVEGILNCIFFSPL